VLARERPAALSHCGTHRAQSGGTEARADRLLDPQIFLRAALAREAFTFR
jgi:hypothetical protein